MPGHVEWKYYSHDGPSCASGCSRRDWSRRTRRRWSSPRPLRSRLLRRTSSSASPRTSSSSSRSACSVAARYAPPGEVSVAVVAMVDGTAGLGRAGRLRGRRRVRRPVRRHHAARVPRARALSRDRREARRARARARLPLALLRRAADEPPDPRAARLRSAHDDDAVRHSCRSSLSFSQRGSRRSSTCSCGSALRSLPQTGQRPAQSGRQRI